MLDKFRKMNIIKLLRVKEWIKNLFIFIPAFFAGTFNDVSRYPYLLFGFLAFSFVASGIYIFNDYRDVKEDRLHPIKKNRPLASGAVSLKLAFNIMWILFIGGLAIGFYLDKKVFMILLIYAVFNLLYSSGLKHVSILDVLILSSGFILRVIAGGVISVVPISQWLIIMVFLLSLFLALAKRRDDLLIFITSNKVTRKSIKEYNMDFLNIMLAMLCAVIIVAYIMYTISPEVTRRLQSEYVYTTVIYVIAGIMRYLQIIYIKEDSGSPTLVLYKDKFIIFTLLGWIIHYFILIYTI